MPTHTHTHTHIWTHSPTHIYFGLFSYIHSNTRTHIALILIGTIQHISTRTLTHAHTHTCIYIRVLQIPRLRRHHIENCGHWTQQEHPHEVNSVLLQWLHRDVPTATHTYQSNLWKRERERGRMYAYQRMWRGAVCVYIYIMASCQTVYPSIHSFIYIWAICNISMFFCYLFNEEHNTSAIHPSIS